MTTYRTLTSRSTPSLKCKIRRAQGGDEELRLSDAPERLSGEECEPAGGAPLRATTSAVHVPGEFNQQSIGGLWRPRVAATRSQ